MRKPINILNSPWTIAVVAPIITLLLMKLIDAVSGTSLLAGLLNLIMTVINFFTSKYTWKLYQLILLFLSTPIIGLLIAWGLLESNSSKESSFPKWFSYKNDLFKDVTYSWEWIKNFDGNYHVRNIRAHCPNCDCKLLNKKCPNCQKYIHIGMLDDSEIESLIHYRIEKKEME